MINDYKLKHRYATTNNFVQDGSYVVYVKVKYKEKRIQP